MKTKTKSKNLKKSRAMKFRSLTEQELKDFKKKQHLRYLQHPSFTYCYKCDSHWHYEEMNERDICPSCNEFIN